MPGGARDGSEMDAWSWHLTAPGCFHKLLSETSIDRILRPSKLFECCTDDNAVGNGQQFAHRLGRRAAADKNRPVLDRSSHCSQIVEIGRLTRSRAADDQAIGFATIGDFLGG